MKNNPLLYSDENGLAGEEDTPPDDPIGRAVKKFKDLYKKYKDIKAVYAACKTLFDESGKIKDDCCLVDCLECTKVICSKYAGEVGTTNFGLCYYPDAPALCKGLCL